jgi:FAD/FMN-containing dehydrogenase
MFLIVQWPNEDEAGQHVDYIRRYWRDLEPHTDGYYTVDTADESRAVRHGNYQGNFPRLMSLKKKYDPTNLFRLNANINPAA